MEDGGWGMDDMPGELSPFFGQAEHFSFKPMAGCNTSRRLNTGRGVAQGVAAVTFSPRGALPKRSISRPGSARLPHAHPRRTHMAFRTPLLSSPLICSVPGAAFFLHLDGRRCRRCPRDHFVGAGAVHQVQKQLDQLSPSPSGPEILPPDPSPNRALSAPSGRHPDCMRGACRRDRRIALKARKPEPFAAREIDL